MCCNAFRYGQCNQDVRQVGGVCRVVSCTPSWRFEECSTAPATDNRTVDHNSDRLPQRYTPITAHYIALGENGSVLGASVYGEVATAGGNITDLTTRLSGPLYVLVAEVDLPAGVGEDLAVRLATAADELGVDVTLRRAETDVL